MERQYLGIDECLEKLSRGEIGLSDFVLLQDPDTAEAYLEYCEAEGLSPCAEAAKKFMDYVDGLPCAF